MTSSAPDRTVHARLDVGVGVWEVVRYDRQGRWYVEGPNGRHRLGTVHEAASRALDFEQEGGTIFPGEPGGQQFDAKVAGGHRKGGRR